MQNQGLGGKTMLRGLDINMSRREWANDLATWVIENKKSHTGKNALDGFCQSFLSHLRNVGSDNAFPFTISTPLQQQQQQQSVTVSGVTTKDAAAGREKGGVTDGASVSVTVGAASSLIGANSANQQTQAQQQLQQVQLTQLQALLLLQQQQQLLNLQQQQDTDAQSQQVSCGVVLICITVQPKNLVGN